MTFTTTNRIRALAFAAAFAIGACTSGGGTTTAPAAASQAPASGASDAPEGSAPAASGSINVSGSSTVEPISTGVAEALAAANPDFTYAIKGPGTGDGFKVFCKGETDISDASRKIKDEEAKACTDAGIEYIELAIAYDGMTVMTNPDNTAVTCLSFADLYALVGPESQGFTKWTDAQALAKGLGSNTTFPDADLAVTGPGEESGTYDSFVEIALDKIADPRGKLDPATKHTATRPDYQASANDNTIIEGITGAPASLGWVGFAFAEENKDKVAEIQVSKDPNGTCVAPTAETIADGSYPLARTLYIYINKAKAKDNPAVAGYVDYYLADGTISTVLETVPYVNLPADKLAESRSTWDASK
ncbi:MAG TPA: substrate-binding domain-containing protein [Candidatus Limnocylindrales bacterium]|nr:substrate-binding domain-containing protein [Candidatus Limnocylindrales bacterium]